LLEQALTHSSVAPFNNQRLEFLGDAVVGQVAADMLYSAEPRANEGKLTRLRARMVRRESLAQVARELDLGACLRLGNGELKNGGRDRDSMLADAFEALMGAIYLDAGFGVCAGVLRKLLQGPMQTAIVGGGEARDAKTRLQEGLQARGLALPRYEVVEVTGADHARHFTVACAADGLVRPARGRGVTRRKAEQEAAHNALIALGA